MRKGRESIERPVQHERRQHLTQLVARYREFYPKVVVELTLSQRTPDQSEDRHDVIITFARELPDSQMVAQLLGAMLSVLCAALAYLKKRGVPMRPMDLRQHRYLRRWALSMRTVSYSTARMGSWMRCRRRVSR